jgi:serine/threonine protein kinase/tetratricopeptide (TPR) repeat protein
MDAVDADSLKHLFERASRLLADEQLAFLKDACRGDPARQAELESLLAAAEEAEGFFDSLADAVLSLPHWSTDPGSAPPETRSGPDPLIGRMVHQYRIEEKLGSGGMGVVYRAHDTGLNRAVALKFLPPHLRSDDAATQRFLVEAQAAAALDHPNACNVHEIGEDEDGRVFIAMAYYEGETLRRRLERGSLPIEEALDYAQQIAAGLGAAHAHDIVHRDIKPANVIITPEGVAKVLDFGLAKLTDVTLTGTGTTLGTVAYMSPEQVQGEGVDHRTDLWSLGVVLYEMLAGQRPFKGDTTAVVFHAIQHEGSKPPSALRGDLPSGLDATLAKALAKAQDDRFATAEEFARALQSRETGPEVSTEGPGRRISRRSVLVWAGVAAIAGLTTFGLVTSSRSGGARPEPSPPTSTDLARTAIAVLPFENLSAGGEHAYFAGGLHSELLTQLAKVAALTVTARTSVLGYADTHKPLSVIADELGVGSIVEGSVQVLGDRLRVNVTLLDGESGGPLWAETYDGSLEDAFAVQSEVAQQVVTAMGAALTETEVSAITAAPTDNPEAYLLFLQGEEYRTRAGYTKQDLEIAQQLYERALVMDPTFALAYASLSQVHAMMYWLRYDPSATRLERQRDAAEAALGLAPDLPQTRWAMGLVYYYGERDYARALEELTAAVARLPGSGELRAWVGYAHRRLGNWDEALAAFEMATAIDPRDALIIGGGSGHTLAFLHRYGDAIATYDRALRLAPDAWALQLSRARAYLGWRGELDTLRSTLLRGPEDYGPGGSRDLWQVQLAFWEREPDTMLALLAEPEVVTFEDQGSYGPGLLYAAWAHQLRGDRDAARPAFTGALAQLDSALRELPDDWRVHAARGLALAGMGRGSEARLEAEWIRTNRPGRHYGWTYATEAVAMILAQTGDAEGALHTIEPSVAGPSFFSVHNLRLDPRWDPIRDDPRFRALLERYAEP